MILNNLDDVGVYGVPGLGDVEPRTATQAFTNNYIIGGTEPTVVLASWAANFYGEAGNRYYIIMNPAGPATPTVTQSGFAFTINFLAGTTTCGQVQSAFNAATTLLTMTISGTSTIVMNSVNTTIPLNYGYDYHGSWGDVAVQYDDGNDATAIVSAGHGWPTWGPPVPTPRTLYASVDHALVALGGQAGNGWSGVTSGTGATVSASNDATYDAYRYASTGTTATGISGVVMGANTALCCQWNSATHTWRYEGVLQLPVLSSAADTFLVQIGFTKNFASAPSTDYAMVEIQNGVANFQCMSAIGGVSTSVDSGVAVTAGTWYRIVIIVTNNTRIDYYIVPYGSALPSTPSATITTNITNTQTSAGCSIIKQGGTTGTTACLLYILSQMCAWNGLP